jgi:hypothetical protein
MLSLIVSAQLILLPDRFIISMLQKPRSCFTKEFCKHIFFHVWGREKECSLKRQTFRGTTWRSRRLTHFSVVVGRKRERMCLFSLPIAEKRNSVDESRSKTWQELQLNFLSLSLSFCLYLWLCVCLSFCQSVCLSISLSLYICLYIFLSVY